MKRFFLNSLITTVDVVVRGIVLTSLVDDNVAAADGLSRDGFFFLIGQWNLDGRTRIDLEVLIFVLAIWVLDKQAHEFVLDLDRSIPWLGLYLPTGARPEKESDKKI